MTDETMPDTIAPGDRMTEIDDLATYLGGRLTGPNMFVTDLLRMIDKYDGIRREKLAAVAPEAYRVWQIWNRFAAPPTRAELTAELERLSRIEHGL